jgi:hypothetical protein
MAQRADGLASRWWRLDAKDASPRARRAGCLAFANRCLTPTFLQKAVSKKPYACKIARSFVFAATRRATRIRPARFRPSPRRRRARRGPRLAQRPADARGHR